MEKPDWFEHYKDGKLHGEERRWHANGRLWQINHYIDDQEVFPSECWYYAHTEDSYNNPNNVSKVPDFYEYKYQASEGHPLYYVEETYALEDGEKKYLLKRKYFEEGTDEPICFTDGRCDSVKRGIVTIGSQKRLEIKRLLRWAAVPFRELSVFGERCAGCYNRKLFRRRQSDRERVCMTIIVGEMMPVRLYDSTGADLRKLEFSEYMAAKADSCNTQLDLSKGRYTDSKAQLSVRWKKGTLALLNSPLEEDEDGFRKWYYDGYQSDYGLHFFHFSGFESWGYFAMSDATGEVYKYNGIDTPLFCGKSGLFLVVDESPYEGRVLCPRLQDAQ